MRVGSSSTAAKPAVPSLARYSRSSSAPATHPIQSSTLRRIWAGTSPRTTTSDTAKRPPGRRTRNASAKTRSLSADRLITQLEMMTSTELSGRGIASISPLRNSTLSTPAFFWFSRASASISSVMSSPYALPPGPTRLAESNTSIPPPEPRSSTVSPVRSSASAVGLPQPSDAATAAAGSTAVSLSLYRLEVIGSSAASLPQQALVEQHEASSPATTFSAAFPYLSLTVCLMSCSAIPWFPRDASRYEALLDGAQQALVLARVSPVVRSA